ncbi:hypothetical protein JHC43_18475 [Marinobacter salarius]|uniref:hypothetical protein n=1 Tax=Marinobacter salarius TaxID=1420917 RepID=UPI0018F14BCA|nr:hypothetical protein [Marinobacter salarius]MBJ7278470.1 hypothetical protein [Marinobacter salarius]
MLAWTVILFFLLNQVQPLYNTSFSFQRVSFFVIVLFFVCARRIPFKFDIFTIFLFLISLFLTVYSLLLSFIFDSDFIQTSRFFHFLVFSLLSPFIVCYLLKDEVRFHKAIVFASLAQVIFIIFTYSSGAFSNWVFHYIDSGSQILTGARATGLSSSGGAALSVVVSLGALSILRLSDLNPRIWHFTALVVITVSVGLVARTGMLVSLMSLFLLILRGRVSVKGFLGSFAIAILLGFAIFDVIKNNPQFFGYTLSWALSVFSGSDQTLNVLLSQDLRELSDKILFFGGVGVSNADGSNASGSDMGYLQTVYAVGVPLGAFFYIIFFLYLLHFKVGRRDVFFKNFLIFLIFLLEVKEPFIFKYAISFYVLASILYMRKVRVIPGRLSEAVIKSPLPS